MAAWKTSRSEIITAQVCPRKAWYSRFYGGTGISRKRTSLPLAFGSAFHAGAEKLLTGDVEGAVAAAHLYLDLAFSNEAIDIEQTETAYAIGEQKAIVEGLIRGWWAKDGERFLRDFEVIEVEREGRAILSSTSSSSYNEVCQKFGDEFFATRGKSSKASMESLHMAMDVQAATMPLCKCGHLEKDHYVTREEMGGMTIHNQCSKCGCYGYTLPLDIHGSESKDDLVLMFRPDALVRERQSGDHYLVSWKTTSMAGSWTMAQASTDMQSMSEAFGVEQQSGIRVEGILYLIAVKGQRKKDEYVGAYRQNSPLAYAWMRKGATEEDTEWAWRYGWDTEEINPKTGKAVGTKLGKGFRLVPVWQEYPGGEKAWIADLAAQRIAPRHLNALEAAFPQSLPVSRRTDEKESWRRQVVAQEQRTQIAVKTLNVIEFTPEAQSELLDMYFPQHTHSCFRFNSKCEFFECCWNPAVKADPLASGLYQISIPNHPKGDDDDE